MVVTINNITAGTIAASQQICSGGDPAAFTVSIAATGSGSLTYQWQSSTGADCISGYSNIAGATGATYDPPSGLTVATRYRRVDTSTLNGVKCTAITNCVAVTIKPAPLTPSLAYHPPACDDSVFYITVSNVTAGASYTLVDKNGNPIPKAIPASPYVASGTFDFTNIPAGSGYSVTVSSNGCGPASAPAPCGEPDVAGKAKNNLITETISQGQGTIVKAYPNPFSDKINFVITTQTGGQGALEVFNFMGQKVKTVYTGFIGAGTQTYELNMPAKQIANLVYVLRVGDKKITGKLLQMNQ